MCYIDAFAGPGVHLSRASGEWVLGSPLKRAIRPNPPFKGVLLHRRPSPNRTQQLL